MKSHSVINDLNDSMDKPFISKGEEGMERKLDKEWVYLMIQAKKLGISLNEIRQFLQQKSLTDSSQLENSNKACNLP